ncbi:hypothetical protein [Zobellella maritima]|uniref:hypothetical protein n=1 Tax=Zobellella maritima TaxID=2059725 RepID=UPI000E302416|nr:hypothetical protein [Zobellella maritima]
MRFHRKALKLSELEPLNYLPEVQLLRLIRLLRLAVALNRRRQDNILPELKVEPVDELIRLRLPTDWCDKNQLPMTPLERDYQAKVNWSLELLKA